MREYRFKVFDRFGRVRSEIGLPFEDDEEAISLVIEHSAGFLTELWEGDRLVLRLDAK